MRIAVVTRYATRVGGVETYLEQVLPVLAAHGHTIGVWYEFEPATGAERVFPDTIPQWHLEAQDRVQVLTLLAAWKPDVVFLHGLSSSVLEELVEEIAPVVAFLHGYHGTCISGTKTHSFPTFEPCSQTLGPGCLVRYYPQRCGGWSPVSMWSNYRQQRRRQSLLTRCAFVTTLSEHMRHEAIGHGVDPVRAVRLPLFAPTERQGTSENTSDVRAVEGRSDSGEHQWHLLFAGRMERLKGGEVLLDALAKLEPLRQRRLLVTFAGDGRERDKWERLAAGLSSSEIEVRFVGSFSPSERARVFEGVDLLVVPSVWPEPFGLIGLEAAIAGNPAIAFDVCGIGDWLSDGVTGRLLPKTTRWSAALASGIDDCLSVPARLREWGAAARLAATSRMLPAHVDALEAVLLGAVQAPRAHEPRIPTHLVAGPGDRDSARTDGRQAGG